jgi:DNA (cytosine-5)-methyltransferase 1
MLFRTRQGDERSVYEQALQEVASSEVFRKRECIFTHLRDAALTTIYRPAVPSGLSDSKSRSCWLFNNGTLVCRYVYIDERYHYSKESYAGEARVIYKRECNDFQKQGTGTGTSSSGPQNREVKTEASSSQTTNYGVSRQLTLCDFFCGIGGVSEGGRRAGFNVHLGLEKDATHMKSYQMNFPEVQWPLHMDAQDFTSYASRECHSGDHCHLSCPCQYWSICQ